MSAKSIVIYSKAKGCVQCDATDRAISKTDILVTKLDGSTDENREFCQALGYMQAPVVLVYQGGKIVDSWSGNNPFKIAEIKNDPLVERVPADAHDLAA